MAKIYANLVIAKLWTLEKVPLLWRDEVKQLVNQSK